jgi:hypothetical protein
MNARRAATWFSCAALHIMSPLERRNCVESTLAILYLSRALNSCMIMHPRPAPRTRAHAALKTSRMLSQDPLLPLACRPARHGNPDSGDPRGITRLERLVVSDR